MKVALVVARPLAKHRKQPGTVLGLAFGRGIVRLDSTSGEVLDDMRARCLPQEVLEGIVRGDCRPLHPSIGRIPATTACHSSRSYSECANPRSADCDAGRGNLCERGRGCLGPVLITHEDQAAYQRHRLAVEDPAEKVPVI